jgi:uncharacterized protein (TIGR02246 family)
MRRIVPVKTTDEEIEIRGVVDHISKVWENHDPDGFADAYTQDASMILSGDRFLQGREVIRKVITQQFKSAHKGTTLMQNIVDVRFLTPESAVAITEGGVLASGETLPAPEREIRATWVFSKENGAWLIAAYQNTRMADGTLPGE